MCKHFTTCTDPKSAFSDSNVKEFSIVAEQWEFVPDKIYVMRSDNVRLKIKSVDVTHGFSMASYDINNGPGKEVVVEFIADKPSASASLLAACLVVRGMQRWRILKD